MELIRLSDRLSIQGVQLLYTKCPPNDYRHTALAEVTAYPGKLICRHNIIWDDVDVLLLQACCDSRRVRDYDVDKLANMLADEYTVIKYIKFIPKL